MLQVAKRMTKTITEKLWDSFIEARLLTKVQTSGFALEAIMNSKSSSIGCSGAIPRKLPEIGGFLKITPSIQI